MVDKPIRAPNDRAVRTSTRRYGSNPRWLLKALREVAHEVQQLTWDIDDALLTRRPPPETGLREDWSILEIVGFLRDSEAEDLRAVQAICARSGARLTERRAHLGPGERSYRLEDFRNLLWEFSSLREELLWTLQWADSAWEHKGIHPHRGEVTLNQFVHEINERDLEAMWSLRRLCEADAATRARRSGGRPT